MADSSGHYHGKKCGIRKSKIQRDRDIQFPIHFFYQQKITEIFQTTVSVPHINDTPETNPPARLALCLSGPLLEADLNNKRLISPT